MRKTYNYFVSYSYLETMSGTIKMSNYYRSFKHKIIYSDILKLQKEIEKAYLVYSVEIINYILISVTYEKE